MSKALKRRVSKLENCLCINQKQRRIAKVIYDPNICPQSDLPQIDADCVLCLPDNGRRMSNDYMPPEGYMIEYTYVS